MEVSRLLGRLWLDNRAIVLVAFDRLANDSHICERRLSSHDTFFGMCDLAWKLYCKPCKIPWEVA